MKTWKILIYVLIFIACGSASAQRRVLPIVDLIDVPVALANTKNLTADQVRGAIVASALAAEWDVELMSNGSLHLSVYKNMEYRITMQATYTATKYTLLYIGSENLRTTDSGILNPTPTGEETLASYAEKWRSSRGAKQPEFKFAIDRQNLFIHPTYELLVYELSAGIRRHLRLIQ